MPAATDFRHQRLLPRVPDSFGAELFQLAAPDREKLLALLQQLARRAQRLSRAELADLAHAMEPNGGASWRACLVADSPAALVEAAIAASADLDAERAATRRLGARFSWSAPVPNPPAVHCLFPGQGSLLHLQPASWVARYSCLRPMAEQAATLLAQDIADTAVVQPLLAEVALAGIALLDKFGIVVRRVLGHSFGELPALCLAEAISAEQLRALAAMRGRCMRDHAEEGAMLALRAGRGEADALAERYLLDLACVNGAARMVLAGARERVDAAARACAAAGIVAEILPTTRAFHSHGMATAQRAFAAEISNMAWQPLRCEMVSSITGGVLASHQRLPELLATQLTDTVKFADALAAMGEPDLLLEVGAGAVLSVLAEERFPGRVFSLDVFGQSQGAMLAALGAAWTCGALLRREVLYEGRQLRPITLKGSPKFIANPCGGLPRERQTMRAVTTALQTERAVALAPAPVPGEAALDSLRTIVAGLTGLAEDGLSCRLRMLADLHLNSIRARHAVVLTAQRMGIAQVPFDLASIANASLADVASYLEGLRQAPVARTEPLPASISPWWRFFSHTWRDTGQLAMDASQPHPSVWLDDALCPLHAETRALLAVSASPQNSCSLLVLPGQVGGETAPALLKTVHTMLSTTGGAGGGEGYWCCKGRSRQMPSCARFHKSCLHTASVASNTKRSTVGQWRWRSLCTPRPLKDTTSCGCATAGRKGESFPCCRPSIQRNGGQRQIRCYL
jgi:enediyne polyketide synthase